MFIGSSVKISHRQQFYLYLFINNSLSVFGFNTTVHFLVTKYYSSNLVRELQAVINKIIKAYKKSCGTTILQYKSSIITL